MMSTFTWIFSWNAVLSSSAKTPRPNMIRFADTSPPKLNFRY